jgi:hypothetical protein
MTFGEVFSKTLKEFKLKFKVNSKVVLYFIFIPGLISLFFSTFFAYTQNLTFGTLSIISALVAFLFFLLATTSLLYSTLLDKKDYSSSVVGGKKFYWRYLFLMIVQIFFLVCLFLALIVPAIIFGVYWAFAECVLVRENKGIMDSLRGSFGIVKNNWWKVVGYGLLFSMVVFGIQLMFSIPSWPTSIMVFLDAARNPSLYMDGTIPTNLSIINDTISSFFNLLSNFIVIPLGIIFFKYFYLALKKKK